jgi:CubicO group peptidase (beta-lactamase class C family)
VTLRHLLTHTAGFSYEIWNPDILAYQQATGIPMITTCENRALTTPLTFDPGEDWDYGINIDWVGKMVEKVSGQRLGAYLAENVLAPLGMRSTGFRITEEMRGRMAKIHHRGEDGSLAPSDLEIEQNPEFEMGGGGLYGTVVDYAKFTRMILDDGEGENGRVLKPETVATMAENHAGSNRVRALVPALPPQSNTAEFFPGLPKSWGLTFMINEEDAPTGRPAGSLGWAGLANAYYWIDRKNGVSGVYATQVLPFGDVKALPLYLDIEKTVYDHLGEIA